MHKTPIFANNKCKYGNFLCEGIYMSAYRQLWVEGALLNKQELYSYLENILNALNCSYLAMERMLKNVNILKIDKISSIMYYGN